MHNNVRLRKRYLERLGGALERSLQCVKTGSWQLAQMGGNSFLRLWVASSQSCVLHPCLLHRTLTKLAQFPVLLSYACFTELCLSENNFTQSLAEEELK